MAMVYCRGCGNEIHESAPSCPKCGALQVISPSSPSGVIPASVAGWSWGAALLSWIWAIGNGVWIGLLSLVPIVNIVMFFVLGSKGREWAWKSGKWDNLEHFNRVQKKWSQWAVGIHLFLLGIAFIGIILAVIIPQFSAYKDKSRRTTAAINQKDYKTDSSSDRPDPSIATTSSNDTATSIATSSDIEKVKALLVNDPKNHMAWVQLGNAYFDKQMPAEAVKAYDKALELNPNDPNVLCDQGIMLRQLGLFEKAVNNFTKANEVDPTNTQSLFNMGILYRYDLHDYAKAKDVWKKYLTLSPVGDSADRIRGEIRQIEAL